MSDQDQIAQMQRWRLRGRIAAMKMQAERQRGSLHVTTDANGIGRHAMRAATGAIQSVQHSIRREARCNYLAYAFLRLRPYRMVERVTYTHPREMGRIWKRVMEIVIQHSISDLIDSSQRVLQRFHEWRMSTDTEITPENRAELERRWKATAPPPPPRKVVTVPIGESATA